MNEVDKGTRLLNYIIDFSFITVLSQAFVVFSWRWIDSTLTVVATYFLYYFLFETFGGRTLGKFVTQSKVVDFNNQKPNVFRILLRSLLRFNPLDWYSYAFGQAQGTHDVLSRTKLILIKKS
jgi:uncharacterized RDD family membrane protein YckC